MSARFWVAVCAAVVLAGASLWLYRDNRRLRDELAASSAPAPGADDHGADRHDPSEQVSAEPVARKPSRFGKAFRRLTQPRGDRPELEGDEHKETRAERRMRRQEEIRAFLGRDDGETEEEYRERMVPLIKGGLSEPRDRLEQRRRELEDLAGVDDDQRAKLDAAFDDAYQEAIDLANQAISSGDLTPYERNWGGVLNFGGGIGAILNSAQGRIGTILTPEQQDIFRSQGFEWGEYLGVRTPWEDLNPPPPPPGNGG